MDFLVTIIIGGIAGWIAGMVMRDQGFGILGNVVIGLVGGVIGLLIFRLLGLYAEGNWGYLVASVVGSILLLTIAGAARPRKTV